MEQVNEMNQTALLSICRVLETSSFEEADGLLNQGAKLLGVAKQTDDGREYFIYSIGFPDSVVNLPG